MTTGRVLAGTALLGLAMILGAGITALVLYAGTEDILATIGFTGLLLVLAAALTASETL